MINILKFILLFIFNISISAATAVGLADLTGGTGLYLLFQLLLRGQLLVQEHGLHHGLLLLLQLLLLQSHLGCHHAEVLLLLESLELLLLQQTRHGHHPSTCSGSACCSGVYLGLFLQLLLLDLSKLCCYRRGRLRLCSCFGSLFNNL